MKKTLMSMVVAGMLVVPLAQAGPGQRQARQGRRIGQGVHSGQLTRHETRGLARGLERNQRALRRDRKDGGVFTPRERAINHERQDRLSRQIYRQKHDNQVRPKAKP